MSLDTNCKNPNFQNLQNAKGVQFKSYSSNSITLTSHLPCIHFLLRLKTQQQEIAVIFNQHGTRGNVLQLYRLPFPIQ